MTSYSLRSPEMLFPEMVEKIKQKEKEKLKQQQRRREESSDEEEDDEEEEESESEEEEPPPPPKRLKFHFTASLRLCVELTYIIDSYLVYRKMKSVFAAFFK